MLCSKYDGQPVIIWNDRRGSTTRRVGGVGNVITVLDTTPTKSRAGNIKYSSIKLINAEVNIVNSVQPFTDLSMVIAVRILGLQRKTKTKHADALSIIIPMRFEDFDILINKVHLNDTREFDPVYCLQYNSR